VDTIAQLVASDQFEPGECAVMYRTNAQSRLLEEAFLNARLPYRLVGAQRFYGRREVKDMIAYLRLAYNANDEASLTRIINVPTRGIGSKTIASLYTAARAIGLRPARCCSIWRVGLTHPTGNSSAAVLLSRWGTSA
jgi:DNA helicase-2/ATP-dependent DNA helicase PcrA